MRISPHARRCPAVKDFELVFYQKPNGEYPAIEFINSLNNVMKFKMMHQLDLLEIYGNNPRGDFSRFVKDGIFEVRAQNRTDITRVFFFFDKDRKIVLTHGFIKKTQRLPSSELETAIKYREDYLSREAKREKPKEAAKTPHTTSGPKWRPVFDELVNGAQNRCAQQEFNSYSPSKQVGRH